MGDLSQFAESSVSLTVQAIVDHYKKKGDSEPLRKYLGASIIGHECDRYLWYLFRQCVIREFKGRLYRLFDTGHRSESRFSDDLRAIGRRLATAEVASVIPISHGNAWSLYFTDPEGNGLECFVDTPFHVAQPYADGLDLSTSDDEIEATTRGKLEGLPEFQPFDDWRRAMAARLDAAAEG